MKTQPVVQLGSQDGNVELAAEEGEQVATTKVLRVSPNMMYMIRNNAISSMNFPSPLASIH
jgi:hypothetical protein